MQAMRLYIGVETKAREFDAKLLLACAAAEAGFDTVLGQQKIFVKHLAAMPRGIWLNKSISPSKVEKYAHYKKLGYALAGYDEEGLVPFNADEYKKRRIAVGSLEQLECFFAWGPWQADVIAEKAPAQQTKIVVVGHPRVDLTRRELRGYYADEVKALRAQYGQFVLVNTNFSFYNHFHGVDGKIAMFEKAGKIADEAQRQYYLQLRDYKKVLFYKFVEMVAAIRQRFPELAVVVRPHPSENHAYWQEVLPKDEKIHVAYAGGVLAWILAAKVMIHNSCTTGIEGYLLEQPVLAYRPVQADDLENQLPNLLSDQVDSLPDVLAQIDAVLHGGVAVAEAVAARKHTLAAQYIASLNGPLACDRTVARLQQIQIAPLALDMLAYRLYTNIETAGKRALNALREAIRPAVTRSAKPVEYRAQKFPGIELTEIEQGLAKFRDLTGRFAEVRVTPLDKNLFRLVRVNKM